MLVQLTIADPFLRCGRAACDKEAAIVRELMRTNDMVLVSAVGALLDGADIHHLVLDSNMSVVEGSLGVAEIDGATAVVYPL